MRRTSTDPRQPPVHIHTNRRGVALADSGKGGHVDIPKFSGGDRSIDGSRTEPAPGSSSRGESKTSPLVDPVTPNIFPTASFVELGPRRHVCLTSSSAHLVIGARVSLDKRATVQYTKAVESRSSPKAFLASTNPQTSCRAASVTICFDPLPPTSHRKRNGQRYSTVLYGTGLDTVLCTYLQFMNCKYVLAQRLALAVGHGAGLQSMVCKGLDQDVPAFAYKMPTVSWQRKIFFSPFPLLRKSSLAEFAPSQQHTCVPRSTR